MNNSAPQLLPEEKRRTFVSLLKNTQNKISQSPSVYLWFCFLVPALLMYLVYFSMGIHPFGNGSVLVLDLNGQYVYFFESLRNAIYGDGSFLYTFFRALGGEYMGIYAYYLASPLSYLVALFPASRMLEALLTIILIKTGLCSLSFGFYLHKHSANPNKIMVVAFSVMYALCSFAVVHQNNIMWIDSIFWLPIVTYSIEQLIKHRKYKLFVISLAISMISNYYIGYMICIYSLVYFFYYLAAHGSEVINPHNEKRHILKSFLRFAGFAALAAAIAGFIIIAAYYSLGFGKNDFSSPDVSLKAKFSLLDFFTKLLPGSYDTVRPEGLPFVYCGMLSVILAPVYFMTKNIRSREKIATLALLSFFVLCFISPLDIVWHGFQNPNWLNHRYSFMFCFVLLVVGYKAFGNLRQVNEKFILAICAFIVLFVCVCEKLEFETYIVSSEKLDSLFTVWFTVAITVILFVIICFIMRTRNRRNRDGVIAILAALICIEMFCNSLTMVAQFDSDVSYSNYSGYNTFIGDLRPVVDELNEYDSSFYRAEKTMHRKYNDNMALGLRGLSNSTSTLNASTIKFLSNMGYTSRSHLSQYNGGTPVNDSLLGVKYVIDHKNSQKLVNYFEKIENEFSSEKYDVYKNPYALSVAYEVSADVNELDLNDYNTYFEKLNALVGAMQGSENVPEIFKPVTQYDTSYSGCEKSANYFRTTYTALDGEKAVITYSFVADTSAEYYFYTPPEKTKDCILYVNGTSLGNYLGNNTKHIFSLGWFEEGEDVTVEIEFEEESLALKGRCDYIWYLDRPVFEESFADLLDNSQFEIDENYKEDHLTGTIKTDKANTTILSTIAYDEGWQVFVDGEQVQTYQTLDALIAFDIENAGEHRVEFKYMPKIYVVGAALSIIGICIFALLCLADYVLKRTVFANKQLKVSDTPWVLEDFDEIDLLESNIEDGGSEETEDQENKKENGDN